MRECLPTSIVILIFYSETFFMSPPVDVGILPNHINSLCLFSLSSLILFNI